MVKINTENVITGIMVVVFIVVIIWIVYVNRIESVEMAPLNSSCDIQKTQCTTQFINGATVSLLFSPTPVKPVEFFNMQVKTDFPDVRSVQVDFNALNMNMGYYRPDLHQMSDGIFQGEAALSACTVYKMEWEATVLLETNTGTYAAPFQFIAYGNFE